MQIQGADQFDEIVVYGGRGHSQIILIVLEEMWQGRVRLRAVVDDLDHGFMHPELRVPVISGDQRRADFADIPVVLAMGSGAVRAKIAARLAGEGAVLATAVPNAPTRVAPSARFGAGTIVMPYTLISPFVTLGAGVHGLCKLVAHDVSVGDFTTLAYDVVISGHVKIGAGVTIAPGAIIGNGRPDKPLTIGDGAVIGAGTVILRDVPAGARMMGNPALPVRDWIRFQARLRAKD